MRVGFAESVSSGHPGAQPQALARALALGEEALAGEQREDGHWAFELEADATIPAEYILLQHYLDEVDSAVEARIAAYLRSIQASHGGWPLFHAGAFNMSASVKAYFALKAAGDSPDAPHMVRARSAILAHGGAAKSNVNTRILLALFGQVPWHAVPVMPVEIMNLPEWFPFHLSKVAYWSRTVIVPLLVLMAIKPRARNPREVSIAELFVAPPEQVTDWFSQANPTFWGRVFRGLDRVVRALEPSFSMAKRRQAIERAIAFVAERLNGEDGLGAIYPAMANAVMMFDCLGYAPDHPHVLTAKRAVRKLLVLEPERAYCQPCLSPIWDTALASYAMIEVGANHSAERGAAWLLDRQVLDVVGDWAWTRPNLRPGGWPFQYANPHYPDLDDTAAVLMALDRIDHARYRHAIDRGVEWLLGMQSENGGWGAFDADNTHHYLNNIPFADHGALLDPPTADVTARCMSALCQLGFKADHPAIARAIDFLHREQEPDGSWYGRWGTNYIYGTWSVLSALNAARLDRDSPMMRRAVEWLIDKQRDDGGWGEGGESYFPGQPHGEDRVGTPSQTAWAVLGLMAAGEVDHPAVERGIAKLVTSQKADGTWEEQHYTAVGFPRVFYLRYDGYRRFFPLWAVARYRNLKSRNAAMVLHGM
ncbi:MAG: squalene--hopene cyclase [Proteobacteria bacterium]|nr:squalene--hopene cyclase [Pseudomonadota bacterium]MBI3499078.1 squalene--hopene cyclase [Pseudomonadota bacterium]